MVFLVDNISSNLRALSTSGEVKSWKICISFDILLSLLTLRYHEDFILAVSTYFISVFALSARIDILLSLQILRFCDDFILALATDFISVYTSSMFAHSAGFDILLSLLTLRFHDYFGRFSQFRLCWRKLCVCTFWQSLIFWWVFQTLRLHGHFGCLSRILFCLCKLYFCNFMLVLILCWVQLTQVPWWFQPCQQVLFHNAFKFILETLHSFRWHSLPAWCVGDRILFCWIFV